MGGANQDAPLLYVLHSGNLYGTERMALATLTGLREYRTRVVIAPNAYGKGSVEEAARAAGFETRAFNDRPELLKALLPFFLRHRSIDVIGTGVAQSLLCLLLSVLFRVRLRQLHVVHGGTNEEHAYGRKHYLNRAPVTLVAVSNFVRDKLASHGVKRNRIRVIENFLPDASGDPVPSRAPFDPAQPSHRQIDPRRTRVVLVSRVDAIKRLDLLVDAVEREGLDGFVFDVYGTGVDLEALQQRAQAFPNVQFHGFVPDVAVRLAEADLFLHLCPEEPFGLVVLEAFTAGIAVLVPDAGGAGGVVEPGISGLRFRANDTNDLGRQLKKAQAMPGVELQALIDGGRKALASRFSRDTGVDSYRSAFAAIPGTSARS